MESNSDKQMRDKLAGAEFPFDPAAWDQMEAMLDKKKKRRGFFWWWTGGIAAALMLGVVGYQVGTMKSPEPGTRNQENTEVTTNSGLHTTENTGTIAGNSEPGTQNPENTVGKSGMAGDRQLMTAENSDNGNRKAGKAVGKNENQRQAKNERRENGNSKPVAKKGKNTSSVSNAKPGDGFVAFNGKGPAKTKSANRQGAIDNAQLSTANRQLPTVVQQEAQMLSAAGAVNNVEEPGNLKRMEASLLTYLSENAIIGLDNKEEEHDLSRTRGRNFSYSLGVMANVTGTTIGKEEDAEGKLFYNKPSYMVGFTHDFLFVNRIALTNSILYSQTSFEVKRPKAVTYAQAPLKYNSHISELAIPIGIKVYPVAKNNFKFYINTGIINHIKLKETFDYTVDSSTYNLGTAFDPKDNLFPTTNSFEGNIKTMDGVSGAVAEVTTDDFSINKSKRYYVSFYAGAGVEYIAKKHFVLFAEPMFYMGLQKIGVQDKRKYNLGVSGGFRYQF